MSAGIVLVTKFVSPSSHVFGSYVDYIDRDEAIRNENFEKFTAFGEYVGSYMDDQSKTYGLFTADKNELIGQAKEDLKDIYKGAQRNGSLMWQTVISFDNDFLIKNGLYDKKSGQLDEAKLREYTRKSMNVLLEKEGLADAIWSASVHKNTDNIHVHIATVQPQPSWTEGQSRCRSANGKLYQRGKFAQKSIDAAKSAFANSIIKDQIDNSKINELKRGRIITLSRTIPLVSAADNKLRRDFVSLAESLPDDLRLLKYGNNAMKAYRPHIDAISSQIIEKYCADDFRELADILSKADATYKDVYGESKERSFSETHYEDLRSRMGNVILNQAIEYKKNLRTAELRRAERIYKLKGEMLKIRLAGAHINQAVNGIKRTLKNDRQALSNEAAYQRLMQEAEI